MPREVVGKRLLGDGKVVVKPRLDQAIDRVPIGADVPWSCSTASTSPPAKIAKEEDDQ